MRVTLNGVETRALGLTIRQLPRFRSGPARALNYAGLLGGLGQRLLGVASYPARDLQLLGTILGDTYAARAACEDRVKSVCGGAPAEIVVDDGVSVRRTVGTLVTPEIAPYDPQLRSRGSAVSFGFSCESAVWEDVEPTLRHLSVVAPRRFDLPMGTAPCYGVIELMGPAAAPLKVRLRDVGGAVRWELAFQGLSLASSSESLLIDSRAGAITHCGLGTTADVLDELDLASQPFFPAVFDPLDGDYDTAAWPTLETDVGFLRVWYWRAWQ